LDNVPYYFKIFVSDNIGKGRMTFSYMVKTTQCCMGQKRLGTTDTDL